jgi:class 3 adenylate cyclase
MTNLNFGSKLNITIILLTLLAAGLTVFFSYRMGQNFLFTQMQERILDLGRTGAMLVSAEDRKTVKRVIRNIKRRNRNLTELFATKNVPAGAAMPTLSEARANALLQSEDVKRLVQILRKVKVASQVLQYPDQELNNLYEDAEKKPDLKYVYLLADSGLSPDRRFLINIADSEFTDSVDSKNTVGSLFNLKSFFKLRQAFEGESQVEEEFLSDDFGTYLSAGIPIKDKSGEVIAILALDLDVESSTKSLQEMLQFSLAALAVTMLIAIFLTILFARYLVKPIKMLNVGALAVKNRDFETHIDIKTHDELEVLAETFNGMVTEINRFTRDMEELNQAYYRFVPQEFIQNLHKNSVLEVEPGDNIQKKISVLFSHIRSFPGLSENMSPDENFQFINDYLEIMAPRIKEHEGFIDKYIGDAIMALFPSSPIEAVKGGVTMLEGLQVYNARRAKNDLDPIRIGVGIHSGLSMMGTIGSQTRMEATVISDTVNFASRLEGLTKTFGASMLISQATYEEAKGVAPTRYLGAIFAKGKSKSQHIYEVIPEYVDLSDHKRSTKELFEDGVRYYQQEKITHAKNNFAKILRSSMDDRAAKMYYLLCQRHKQGDSVNLVMHAK